jgi:hypothetical protein
MFGRLESFSPALHLSGLRLARVTGADMRRFADVDAAVLAARKANYLQMGAMTRTVRGFVDGVADSLGLVVPVGVFFLSFMQWWHGARTVS